MCQRFGLRPWELDNLTFHEIALYLDSAEKKTITHAEALEHLNWWNSLSPMEKLQYG